MDVGLVGFSSLVSMLVVAAIWMAVRDRATSDELSARGFDATDSAPDSVHRLEELLNARIRKVLVSVTTAPGASRTWLLRLEGVDPDTSTSHAAFVRDDFEPTAAGFTALALSGARPTSWLGRIGLRLTEMGTDSLGTRHRLGDRGEGLFSGDRGFVVWADREQDVQEALPVEIIQLLSHPSFAIVQGVMVDDRIVGLWGPWRRAAELLPLMQSLCAVLQDGA